MHGRTASHVHTHTSRRTGGGEQTKMRMRDESGTGGTMVYIRICTTTSTVHTRTVRKVCTYVW